MILPAWIPYSYFSVSGEISLLIEAFVGQGSISEPQTSMIYVSAFQFSRGWNVTVTILGVNSLLSMDALGH